MPRKLFFRLKDGFPRVKLCFCVLCVLTYLALIRVSGAKLWGIFVFFLCARGVFIPPRPFLGPRHRNGEGSAGICCAAGRPSWHRLSGRPVLCQHAFGRSVAAARAAAGAGAALAGAPAGRAAKSVESGTRCICGRRIPFTVTLWCVLSVLFALMVSVKNAHPAAAGEIVLTQDVMWNIGNANSFALGFPPQDIRFSMVRFSYHYLTELVFGALSIVSGIACYDIYVFYAGPLVLAALLCCLYALGICFYRGHRNKALLFTFAMFLFNCASLWTALTNGTGSFGNTNMMHLLRT